MKRIYAETAKVIASSHLLCEPSNYKKGHEFEIFVQSLFNQESGRFIPVKHDSKSALDYGTKAARATYPDLKFLFSTRNRKFKFAIECKWKQSFCKGLINWAQPYQIHNYLEFQKNWNIPVFVAIGIGGKPSDPELLFVTPLHIIGNHTHVYQKDLMLYNRKKYRRFFYDVRQLKLF